MVKDKFYRGRAWRFGWIIEDSHGDVGNGQYVANSVGATAYYFPLLVSPTDSSPVFYSKQGRYYRRIQAQKFFNYLALGVIEEGMIELTGNIIDLSMMYYLFKYTTTTGPASSVYTHTAISTSTQKGLATGEVVPTISMIFDLSNEDSNESLYPLLMGCTVSYIKTGSQDIEAETEGTLRIKFSKGIAGVNLTTWPTYPGKVAYRLDRTIIAYTKLGNPYPGNGMGWEWEWDDHTALIKWSNHEYPEEAINGNPESYFTVWWAPKDKTLHDDLYASPLPPETDSDLDVSAKMYRHLTNDYSSISFEKCWVVDFGNEWRTVENIDILVYWAKHVFKSAEYEANGLATILDVNEHTNARYEGP